MRPRTAIKRAVMALYNRRVFGMRLTTLLFRLFKLRKH